MSQIVKGIQAKLVAAAASLLILHPAFAFETHVQTPQIRTPTPQLRVPNIHTPTPNVVVPNESNTGSCSDGNCDDARAKRPADKRNPPIKSGTGEPVPAITKYRFFPFSANTSVAGIYQAIVDGGDDPFYEAVYGAYWAAISAAEQSLIIAVQCQANPSLPECASAESVSQAQQDVSDAQNAWANFKGDMEYLMFILAFVETAKPGDSEAEAALVEAAIADCLASPSTCDATITQLNVELADLGVPSTVSVDGNPVDVLQTPAEAHNGADVSDNDTLSYYLQLDIGLLDWNGL
jgi:hypothetical protein